MGRIFNKINTSFLAKTSYWVKIYWSACKVNGYDRPCAPCYPFFYLLRHYLQGVPVNVCKDRPCSADYYVIHSGRPGDGSCYHLVTRLKIKGQKGKVQACCCRVYCNCLLVFSKPPSKFLFKPCNLWPCGDPAAFQAVNHLFDFLVPYGWPAKGDKILFIHVR